MIDPTTRALLQFALNYIEANNTMVANTHRNPRTREIEPGSVRREVLAANQWLEKARRVLKPVVPEVVQDIVRTSHAGEYGALSIGVREESCKVVVRFGAPIEWASFEPQRACDLASALVKHARGAGRKAGCIVEVKL